jgi:diguanylate cyclase (GGDEF)-like protein
MNAPNFIAEIFGDATLDDAWPRAVLDPADALETVRQWQAAHPLGALVHRAFAALIAGHAQVRLGDLHAARAAAAEAATLIAQADLPARATLLLQVRLDALHALIDVVTRDMAGAVARMDAALVEAPRLPTFDRFYLHLLRALARVSQGRQDLAFSDLLVEYDSIATQYPAALSLLQLNLGAVLIHVGDWEGAETTMREALAALRQSGRTDAALICQLNLVYALVQRDRIDEARAWMLDALATNRAYVLRWHAGDVLATHGESLIGVGLLDEAAAYLATLRAEAARVGYRIGLGAADWCEGQRAMTLGDAPAARRHWRLAILRLRRTPQLPHLWKTLRAVADSYAADGQWRRAWRWQRRFHRAYLDWSQRFATARLAYARERQELLRVREQAIRDPATGLLNRRRLVEHLDDAIARAAREGHPLQVCMVDVDNLKPINDRYGHAVGDAAIATVADEMRVALGADALLFRYGGDEFVAVLPEAPRATAMNRLSTLLARLRRWRPNDSDERRHLLTASIGVASYPNDGRHAEALLDAADTALYRSKKAGGNQIAPPA